MSMKSEHIKGLTVLDLMNELDPALVAEAEVSAAYLPLYVAVTADPYTRKKARREAREARREDRREANPFLRFMGSGAGAVAISLIVAFGLISGIIIAVNRAPSGENTPPIGGNSGNEAASSEAEIFDKGKIPTGEIDANYTISTEPWLYEASPKRISVTMRATEPGVAIDYFHAFDIESLTDPDSELPFTIYWTEESMERAEPAPDEYAEWTKSVIVDGVIPNGIYRLHHMEYVPERGYVSAAYCHFAVGQEYAELPLPSDSSADSSDRATESEPPKELETAVPADSTVAPFTISVPDVMQYGEKTLTVSFRATEPGVPLTNLGTPVLEKISGTDDLGEVAFVEPEVLTAFGPEGPDAYAEGTVTYTIENAYLMQDGTYRVSMVIDGETVATAEFFLNTAVDE